MRVQSRLEKTRDSVCTIVFSSNNFGYRRSAQTLFPLSAAALRDAGI